MINGNITENYLQSEFYYFQDILMERETDSKINIIWTQEQMKRVNKRVDKR